MPLKKTVNKGTSKNSEQCHETVNKEYESSAKDTVTIKNNNNNNNSSKKYKFEHMKQYPELYRSDVSIYPSYTGLLNLPYNAICRRRIHKLKKQITRQMNQEIRHIAMMQSHALASVRIDRLFNVGFPQEALIVSDFATNKERRRIRQLMNER